ncbi:MAG: hypothetical protein RSF42_16680 [Comamonas sp.]
MTPIQIPAGLRTRSYTRGSCTALAVVALTALAGCQSKQPPSCESPEVQNTLKSLVLNHAHESAIGRPEKDGSGKIKAGSAYFYNNTSLAVASVFDSGVNKDTKVRSCSATLHLKVPVNLDVLGMAVGMFGVKADGVQRDGDGGLKAKVDYEVQLSDKGDEFQVQSTALDPFIGLVSAGHALVAGPVQWLGRWSGNYRCERPGRVGGLAPEVVAAHAPFQLAIDEQLMEGRELLVERATDAGGFEKLRVSLGRDVSVKVEGANTPQDRWMGNFFGGFKGDKLDVKGAIMTLDGREIAQCAMSLALQPLDEQGVAKVLAASR